MFEDLQVLFAVPEIIRFPHIPCLLYPKHLCSFMQTGGFLHCPLAAGVPSSAVLVFAIELVSFEKGVPPGYLFVWLQENPPNLFEALDIDSNKEVSQEEVQFMGLLTTYFYVT